MRRREFFRAVAVVSAAMSVPVRRARAWAAAGDTPWRTFDMYPQGETAAGVLDSLDPDTFKYSITAREITSAS